MRASVEGRGRIPVQSHARILALFSGVQGNGIDDGGGGTAVRWGQVQVSVG